MKPMQFAPNAQLCVLIIFAIGVIASFLLVIAALIAAAYVLNLAMTAISELATSITTLYNGSDSLVKLLLICIIGYVLARLACSAYRSFQSRAQGGTYGN
jgi:hypothetical protein